MTFDPSIGIPAGQIPPGDYPLVTSVEEARGMLDDHFAVRIEDGKFPPVVLTRVSRLPEITGGEISVHEADQVAATLRDEAARQSG
jgi:hypothetical protein